MEQGSLTQSIQQVCQQNFHVRVLSHEWITTPNFACAALHTTPEESLLHRQVLLCDGDIPLVFACSLLPEAALQGAYAELRTLGSRPLGHWIFSEPVLKRHSMHYAAPPSSASLFTAIYPMLKQRATLVGRKTLFTGAAKPLLVSEFFLPSLRERTPSR